MSDRFWKIICSPVHSLVLLKFDDIAVFNDKTALENAKWVIPELVELGIFFIFSQAWCGEIRNFSLKFFTGILPNP